MTRDEAKNSMMAICTVNGSGDLGIESKFRRLISTGEQVQLINFTKGGMCEIIDNTGQRYKLPPKNLDKVSDDLKPKLVDTDKLPCIIKLLEKYGKPFVTQTISTGHNSVAICFQVFLPEFDSPLSAAAMIPIPLVDDEEYLEYFDKLESETWKTAFEEVIKIEREKRRKAANKGKKK